MKLGKIFLNLFLLSLIALYGGLYFYNEKISYANTVAKTDKMVPVIDNYYFEPSNDEVLSFISMSTNEELGSLVNEELSLKVEKEAKAKKINAEDPIKVAKKNQAVKGVSKEKEVKKEVKRYENNETSLGIDVSEWQGRIDWKKVKEDGIKFAMIRVGFRGTVYGRIVKDKQFENNIKGAIANNINVGVYFFSSAKNDAEALEEAKWVVEQIKNYDISYPVVTDIEIFNEQRLKGVSNAQMTNNALVFCKYIRSKGYTPMIYSYLSALNRIFDTGKFENERVWLAQYNDVATYKGRYYMWQYTSRGRVAGIKGDVDMNVSYFSVTNDVTKKETVNGVKKEEEVPVEFTNVEINTKLNKDVILRTSPYLNQPNKAGSLEKGKPIKVLGIGKEFIKIQYNGDTFYINDLECYDIVLEPVDFIDVVEDVNVIEEVDYLKKPYDFLKDNVVGKLKVGDKIIVTGLNKDYVRFKFNNIEYYVNDVSFYEVIKEYKQNGSGESNQ